MKTIVKHRIPGRVAEHPDCHAEVTSTGSISIWRDGYDDHGVIGVYVRGDWAEVTVVADPKDQEEPVPDESDAIRSAVVKSRMSGWEVRLQQAAIHLSYGRDAEARAIIEDVGREMKP